MIRNGGGESLPIFLSCCFQKGVNVMRVFYDLPAYLRGLSKHLPAEHQADLQKAIAAVEAHNVKATAPISEGTRTEVQE